MLARFLGNCQHMLNCSKKSQTGSQGSCLSHRVDAKQWELRLALGCYRLYSQAAYRWFYSLLTTYYTPCVHEAELSPLEVLAISDRCLRSSSDSNLFESAVREVHVRYKRPKIVVYIVVRS
jgi:hypothetical protein